MFFYLFIKKIKGTQDKNHHFRAIATLITETEDENAYNFAHNSIKKVIKDFFNFNYSPKVIFF